MPSYNNYLKNTFQVYNKVKASCSKIDNSVFCLYWIYKKSMRDDWIYAKLCENVKICKNMQKVLKNVKMCYSAPTAPKRWPCK